MLHKYRNAGFVMALAAILGIALPVSASNEVPFRGYANGVVTVMTFTEEGLQLTGSATGHATHLGRYTRTETITIHDDLTIDGTIVFKAANDDHGDKLVVEVTGVFIPPGAAMGTYTFMGGTGRFSDASGSADFAAALAGGTFTVTFDGSIDY